MWALASVERGLTTLAIAVLHSMLLLVQEMLWIKTRSCSDRLQTKPGWPQEWIGRSMTGRAAAHGAENDRYVCIVAGRWGGVYFDQRNKRGIAILQLSCPSSGPSTVPSDRESLGFVNDSPDTWQSSSQAHWNGALEADPDVGSFVQDMSKFQIPFDVYLVERAFTRYQARVESFLGDANSDCDSRTCTHDSSPSAVSAANPHNIPTVHLLSDNPLFDRTQTIRSALDEVARKRARPFYLGAAWDPTVFPDLDEWASARARDTFNLGVAENFCKWVFTEPSEDKMNVTACEMTKNFWESAGAKFRGHNTLWHNQLPDWLPGDIQAAQLQTDIIPFHVTNEIRLMGASNVLNWDITNEIVGDSTTFDMTADQCVLDAQRWPNFNPLANGTNLPLIPDASFIETVVRAARAAQLAPEKMILNDYATGTNNSKTNCYIKILDRLESEGLKVGGLGFQNHGNAASTSGFNSKDVLKSTFQRLAVLGYTGSITELDLWIADNTTFSLRFQAAIYGDYIDACIYSPNCAQLLTWGMLDKQSWLNPLPGTGVATPLLFDNNTHPKAAYFEVLARLQNFAKGLPEPCSTATSPACDPNAPLDVCGFDALPAPIGVSLPGVSLNWAAPFPFTVTGVHEGFATQSEACGRACAGQLTGCMITAGKNVTSCETQFEACTAVAKA